MKKKWLALFCLLVMLCVPLSGLGRLEAEHMLARALTATGGACSLDTLMAMGSAALHGADAVDATLWKAVFGDAVVGHAALDGAHGLALDDMLTALRRAGMRRGFTASARAREAAAALMGGARTLPPDFDAFSSEPPGGAYQRVGAWYFFARSG